MNRQPCICTAFYHAKGRSPNVTTLSERMKLEIYYKCIVVFFASARRFYRDEKFILFTDSPLTGKYMDYLDAIGVETLVIPESDIRYSSDLDIKNRFPGCLFTLDVIDHIARVGMFESNETMCLLDSDCIFLDRVGFLDDAGLPEQFISGIRLDYPANHLVNGQSRASLSLLLNLMEPVRLENNLITYYGGEYLAYASSLSDYLSEQIRRYFSHIKKYVDTYGNTYTEEHVLSMLMNSGHVRIMNAGKVVKRTWTADDYNNIEGDELEYSVLHLPSEKRRFFLKMFNLIEKDVACLASQTEEQYVDIVTMPLRSCVNPSLGRRITAVAKRFTRRHFLPG